MGNESIASAALSIKIDTILPAVGGVTNGATYTTAVAGEFTEGSATLKKGTNDPVAYISNTTILENGSYVLVVTDLAGNPNSISFTVAIPTTPDVPQNLTVTPGNGQAVITFDPPTDNGGAAITGYTVKIIRVSDNDTNTISNITSPYTASSLINGEEYKRCACTEGAT